MGNLLVPFLIGKIDQFREGNDTDSQLVAVPLDQFLSVIRPVKGPPFGVGTGAGVVSPHDQVVRAIVPPDDCVP